METAEQPTKDLHQSVAKQLGTNPQNLNPEDNGPLVKVQELLKDAGYAAETAVAGSIGDELKVIRVDSSEDWIKSRAKRVLDMVKGKKAA